MSKSLSRSMKSRQIGLLQTLHKVDASAEADIGVDKLYTKSVEEVTPGTIILTVKDKSIRNIEVLGLVSYTTGAIVSVSAVTADSITVLAVDGAGAPIQADFGITLIHAKTTKEVF